MVVSAFQLCRLVGSPERVEVRLLPPGNATFLTSLIEGETLAVAASKALDETSSFDLSASIAGMIKAGVFTALQPGD
jgi:hypothetical protein